MKTLLKRTPFLFILACLLLGGAIVVQSYHTLNDYARLWHRAFWRMRGDDAFERSAVFALKPKGAEFMKFVASVVPPKGKLAVMPGEERGFSSQNMLQFFLIDRVIMACGDTPEQINNCVKTPDYFVPAIDDFPAPELVADKTFVPYPADDGHFRGMYVPHDYSPTFVLKDRPYNFPLILISDLAVLTALFVLGYLAASLILKQLPSVAIWILSFPLGMGAVSWALFLWSWAGGPLTLWAVILVYLVLFGVLFTLRWKQAGKNPLGKDLFWGHLVEWKSWHLNIAEWMAVGALAVLFLVAVIIAVGKGYSLFDDMAIWSLKGYYMAYKGSIFAADKASGHGLAYPLNISLIVSVFALVNGDLLPGSKFLFPLLTGSLLLGCFYFWRKWGVARLVALLGMGALLSVPVIFQYTTYGFANMPFTVYWVLGTLWSIDGLVEKNGRVMAIGGILLSLAGWTRPEGIGFAFATAAMLLILYGFWRVKASRWLLWLVSIGSIAGIWLPFGAPYMKKDQIGDSLNIYSAMWQNIDLSLHNLRLMYWLGRDWLLSIPTWGCIFYIGIALLVIFIPKALINKNVTAWLVAGAALVAFLAPAAIFYVESFSDPDFQTFLILSFNRAYFPAIFLLTTLAVVMTGNPKRPQEAIPLRASNDVL